MIATQILSLRLVYCNNNKNFRNDGTLKRSMNHISSCLYHIAGRGKILYFIINKPLRSVVDFLFLGLCLFNSLINFKIIIDNLFFIRQIFIARYIFRTRSSGSKSVLYCGFVCIWEIYI